MKLKGLLAVALMVGSMSALGCNRNKGGGDETAVAPEENPDTAPVVTATPPANHPKPVHTGEHAGANPGVDHDAYISFGLRTYVAPVAPPAIRTEVIGVAPSARHFWAPGYWRWNGREHIWYGGRWMARREGYTWYNPYWAYRSNRWHYYTGYWHRY